MANKVYTGSPPVLLLGGQENALSVVRSLGKRGIPVFISSGEKCWAYRSRYCDRFFPIPKNASPERFWQDLLLSPNPRHSELKGCVLFACSDEAIEFLAINNNKLQVDFLVEEQDPQLRLATLDKKQTLDIARKIGVPVPKYWDVKSINEIRKLKDEFVYPAIVKPFHTHTFLKLFDNRKFFIVNSYEELVDKATEVIAHNISFMISEMIPGPDSLLCSYYTFIDGDGDPLFHFTKRVIRRAPVNQGQGTYQITEWLPETAELGLKFFTGCRFRGFGNIEFKRDVRDGKLKIIEVNARLTAALEMLPRSGIDAAYILYCYHTGREIPSATTYKNFVRLWSPVGDIDAFRDLRVMGELSFFQWIKSIAHRQIFPFFSISDPLPAILKFWNQDLARIGRKLKL